MSNFGETFSPVARKQHRCEWCLGPIPEGEKHKQFRGMWDSEWQNWRMHNECYDEQQEEARHGECEFTPGCGEIPERLKQLASK
jgi:hypothetical protein